MIEKLKKKYVFSILVNLQTLPWQRSDTDIALPRNRAAQLSCYVFRVLSIFVSALFLLNGSLAAPVTGDLSRTVKQ